MGRVRCVRPKGEEACHLAKRWVGYRVGKELGGEGSECGVVWVRWFQCVRRSRRGG